MKRNKKKHLVLAALLAMATLVAGTFAWVNSQDQKINRVSTAAIKDGSVSVTETFKPTPITAGGSSTKEVAVTNSGNTPVFVRVSYEEVLKYLTMKGVTEDITTPGTTPSALTDNVPVEFDGAKYIDAASGYSDITAKVSGTPTGVKVYGKGTLTVDPVTKVTTVDTNTVAFYEYATGKYQAMNAQISLTDYSAGTAVTDWTFTMTNPTYTTYKNGYSYAVSNWAASSLEGASAEATAKKAALLGSAGTKGSVAYDYTTTALGITAIPDPTVPTAATYIPTVASDNKAVQTDTTALGKSGITIDYGTDIVSTTALATNKWVYNAQDGYFYFTSPLDTGVTTPSLMKKLVYNNEIDKSYTNATFDLVVKMEAIQATSAALSDSTGWNLNGAAESTTKIITDYLASQAVN